MAHWATKSILAIILLLLVGGMYWLSAKYTPTNQSHAKRETKEYLLRKSHQYSILSKDERYQMVKSLEVDSLEYQSKQIQLSDLRLIGSLRDYRSLSQLPGQQEWWGHRRLHSEVRGVELNVRPNDEFLEELWLNDMNVQKSLENLDIQRLPVKAEIVIPY